MAVLFILLVLSVNVKQNSNDPNIYIDRPFKHKQICFLSENISNVCCWKGLEWLVSSILAETDTGNNGSHPNTIQTPKDQVPHNCGDSTGGQYYTMIKDQTF